jgi:hypoxanthine phosphoribosyltransferase
MFTPDFYLPGLDLYIELTTMKQSLATIKNHKLRKIRELYPGIKIALLRKADYERLLARYGAGPLSQARAHGISRILYTEEEIKAKVNELAKKISADYAGKRPLLIGAQRGFLCFMADLMRQITVPLDFDFISISRYGENGNRRVEINKEMVLPTRGRHIIMVEDIVDTGITLSYILNYLKEKQPVSLATCVLLDRPARRIADIKLDYIGFEIPDEFVVGYGLDFKEEYRNLPFIGVPILESPAVLKTKTDEEKMGVGTGE